MNSYHPDTIAAIATGPASGAIGIIRFSGELAIEIARKFFKTTSTEAFLPRKLLHGNWALPAGEVLDDVMCVVMPAPNTFTGEDVCEVYAHGGIFHLRRLLRLTLDSFPDVRLADPGEFSKRAYLNGKLDLTQAEAIHGLVTATSDMAVRGHIANLSGRLKNIVHDLRTRILKLLALVEASFEFPEEDIEIITAKSLLAELSHVQKILCDVQSSYALSRFSEGAVKVAILGEPNVGKSSLFNALIARDRSIVSEIPGTTRDLVDATCSIGGLNFQFYDSAGIRYTTDPIESFGIERARLSARDADLVLMLFSDLRADLAAQKLKLVSLNDLQDIEKKTLCVFTKADLLGDDALLKLKQLGFDAVVSALSGFGLNDLLKIIETRFCTSESVHNYVQINARQSQIVSKSMGCVSDLKSQLEQSQPQLEIVAESLRELAELLGLITGTITTDEVLGEVFNTFCIGK